MGNNTSAILDQTQRQLQQTNQTLQEQIQTNQHKEKLIHTQREEIKHIEKKLAQQDDENKKILKDALKRAEIAEDKQRADALLVKRVISALLKKHSAKEIAQALPMPSSALDTSAAAADVISAANVEEEIRSSLDSAILRVRHLQTENEGLLAERDAKKRQQLCQSLWQLPLCDASFTLRNSHVAAMCGLRLARSASLHEQASGLSASLGFLRRFRDPNVSTRGASIGGSLLWDVQMHRVAALRAALCLEPGPNCDLLASVDHTGGVCGSVRYRQARWSLLLGLESGGGGLGLSGASARVELFYDV